MVIIRRKIAINNTKKNSNHDSLFHRRVKKQYDNKLSYHIETWNEFRQHVELIFEKGEKQKNKYLLLWAGEKSRDVKLL